MDGKLLGEVLEGEKAVGRIETLLILPVATLHLAVMSWHVGTNELMPDAQLGSGDLKQGGQIPPAVGKAVSELKTVVRLDAFHSNASAGIPFEQLFQEVGRGIGALPWVSSQETKACEFVNGSILKQAEFWVCDTLAGDHLHINLNPLAGIGHLLVRLWFIQFFL